MLRRYSREQVLDKLSLDEAELRFLSLHLRELISPIDSDQRHSFSQQDLDLLGRAFRLLREEGQDPAEIRALLLAEKSASRMSGHRQAEILAFTGGRSGAGTAAIIWNLAASMAERGARCAILNASFSIGSAAYPLTDIIARDWLRVLPSGVAFIEGSKLLKAEDSLDDSGRADWINRLGEIDQSYDFIFVDAGFDRVDIALRIATVVDDTIIITTPDVSSNTECFTVIRMLRDLSSELPISILLNRAESVNDAQESLTRLNAAAAKLGMSELTGLGWVAEDDALLQSMANGDTVITAYPASLSARCIGRIADHLVNRIAPATKSDGGGTMADLVEALAQTAKRQAAQAEEIF